MDIRQAIFDLGDIRGVNLDSVDAQTNATQILSELVYAAIRAERERCVTLALHLVHGSEYNARDIEFVLRHGGTLDQLTAQPKVK